MNTKSPRIFNAARQAFRREVRPTYVFDDAALTLLAGRVASESSARAGFSKEDSEELRLFLLADIARLSPESAIRDRYEELCGNIPTASTNDDEFEAYTELRDALWSILTPAQQKKLFGLTAVIQIEEKARAWAKAADGE